MSISTATIPLPMRAGLWVVASYLGLYVFLDWVSYVYPFGPLGITPWNPPPGLSMFVVLRYGASMAPWLWVAALAADFLVRDIAAPWGVQILACGVLATGYATAAVLLKGWLRFDPALSTLRDATAFAAIASMAALVIGTAYVGTYVAFGTLGFDAFAATVGQFWIGDVIGIIVTLPVLLVLARPRTTPTTTSLMETGR